MKDSKDVVRTHTVRLELVDEPGELLRALEPVADNGGNLLSVFHERGNVTPRGYIPIEVDIEATPERFEAIIDALHDADINIVQAGAERYSKNLTVILSGHLIDTDLSDTINRIQTETNTTVTDVTLFAPEGTGDISSARLQMAIAAGQKDATIESIRNMAADKDLRIFEPLIMEGET